MATLKGLKSSDDDNGRITWKGEAFNSINHRESIINRINKLAERHSRKNF